MTKIPKNSWDDMKCGEEHRSNPMDEYLNYPSVILTGQIRSNGMGWGDENCSLILARLYRINRKQR